MVDTVRYLWHPDVHREFEEACHFFLVSGSVTQQSSHRSFSEALRAFLSREGYTSATTNTTFGTFDAMIRVWLTLPRRRHLVTSLTTQSDFNVSLIKEFNATDITYFQPDFRKELPPTLARDTRGAVKDFELTLEGQSDPGQIESFIQDGLLVPVYDKPGVKLFLCLSGGNQILTSDKVDLVEDLYDTADGNGFENVSIYRGSGTFAEILFKGVYPDYSELLDPINELRRTAKAFGYTPFTVLVADYGMKDVSERIGALGNAASPRVLRFIDRLTVRDPLRISARERVGLFDLSEVRLFESTIEYAEQLLTGDAYELFEEVSVFALVQDRRHFNQSLSFLTSLEADLRRLIPRMLNRHLGDKWLARLLEDTKKGREDSNWRDQKPDGWALYDLLQILSAAKSQYPGLYEKYCANLPNGWQQMAREIALLRDDFAHGKLFPKMLSEAKTENKYSILRTIALSIGMQWQVEESLAALYQ